MEWSEKIEIKKYLFGTAVSLGFAGYASNGSGHDFMLLCGIVCGSILNQWLMVKILGRALRRMTASVLESDSSFIFVLQVVLKLVVLGIFFYSLIVYGRHLVLYGLILYTFQLIILVLSIKSSSTFLNKGPPS